MRSRCLVVSLASPRSRTPSFAIAMLSLALAVAHGPRALAEGPFALTSTSFHDGGTVDAAQVFDQDDCKGATARRNCHGMTRRKAPAVSRSPSSTPMRPAPAGGTGRWRRSPPISTACPKMRAPRAYVKKIGAVEARNDFDIDGYGGPCPPAGKPHRYVITVYALNTTDLRLAQGRPALMFDHEIGTATLGSARMVVNYGR